MIGVSLSYDYLTTGEGYSVTPGRFLHMLGERGVGSVELRTVRTDADPLEVKALAQIIRGRGMNVTVHAETRSVESAAEDVFFPLRAMLASSDEKLNVTVHPVDGDNTAMLRSLSEAAREMAGDRVTVALENMRHDPTVGEIVLPDGKPEIAVGDCAMLVLDAVRGAREAGCDNVGICFDMGHYYYYSHKFGAPEVPCAEFMKYVVHTHIHAVTTKLRTHFPLGGYALTLAEYAAAMDGYRGIWNLEVDPLQRIPSGYAPEDAILKSVDVLNTVCR